MKKRVFIFIICVCSILMGCGKDYKYPIGRDTFEVVGDGRFQILSGPSDYNLWDLEKDDTLIDTVISYYDDGKNKLYVRGTLDYGDTEEYVIVNYENNTYSKYDKKHLDDIPQEDLEIIKSDKMKKVPEIEEFINNNGVLYIND